MTPAPEQLAAHEVAADWYLRRQDKSWSRRDEAAFTAWCQADPQNEKHYRSMARTWLDLGQIARPALASDQLSTKPSIPAKPIQRRWLANTWWQRGSWQWMSALASACLVIAFTGWLAYDNIPDYRLDLATGADTRLLGLPDGSRIAVNRNSVIEVRLYPRRREIVLNKGEAFFEVAHNPSRPFTVISGPSEVRVVGTVFDVLTSAPQLQVKVQQGRVEVRPDRHVRDRFTLLTANQAVAVDEASGQSHRFAVSSDMVGDWRSGQLVFRATPLASVAATLARYLGKPVKLSDTALEALPVSGYVAVSAPESFVESLPDLLPVKVARATDGSYRINPR